MASVNINVDVDLDDIGNYDLVEEVCKRLRNTAGRRSLTDIQKRQLQRAHSILGDALSITPEQSIEIKTLDDKMKYEHLVNVFNKYPLSQIETMLPL